MRFSAANCVCGSRNRVTAPATTPCCWPPPPRRDPGDRVVDFGAGVGAAGLAVAKRVAGIELVLVEIDTALAELARGNAFANAIAAEVVVLDVTSAAAGFAAAGLPPDSVDVVLMNPPFNDSARHRASPDKARGSLMWRPMRRLRAGFMPRGGF
jgi:tRNA1(Val) A37 N6-methylase TrmN6